MVNRYIYKYYVWQSLNKPKKGRSVLKYCVWMLRKKCTWSEFVTEVFFSFSRWFALLFNRRWHREGDKTRGRVQVSATIFMVICSYLFSLLLHFFSQCDYYEPLLLLLSSCTTSTSFPFACCRVSLFLSWDIITEHLTSCGHKYKYHLGHGQYAITHPRKRGK